MTDEFSRLIDGEDEVSKLLLSSSDVDVPSDGARRAARAAIGLGVAAAPVSAAAAGSMALGAKLAIVAALGTTVAVGVVLTRSPEPAPPPPTIEVPAVAPDPEPAEVLTIELPETIEAPPAAEPAKRPAPVAKKRPQGLEAEVQSIDSARAAHAAGRHDRALRLLSTYVRRFPSGMLREEADALRVGVLRDAGRTAEAKDAARAFVARYPESSHAAGFGTLLE
ncbi:MAG: tetratricopeptide repeat protein [Deltaproteobacteria bacterium]